MNSEPDKIIDRLPELDRRSTMNGKPVLRVPVSSVLNLHSGFEQKLLCDGPALALGDACAYSCAFCYVPSVYQKLDRVRAALAAAGKRHEEVVILREAAIEVLRGQLLDRAGKPRFGDPNDRRVVYASPADDVAANMDLVRATVEACKLILAHTNWQIRLLSKSTLLPNLAAALLNWAEVGDGEEPRRVTVKDVMSRMIFGVSTGTLDDALASAFEEGTPPPSKRIKSLRMLQDNGFRTYAMICPSLPQESPAEYLARAEAARDALRYDRCDHVWAEVINVRGDSFRRTVAALLAGGFDRAAELVREVSASPEKWEQYNRSTFLAHAKVCDRHIGKLRFLTYPSPANRAWWERHIAEGAVIL